MIDGIKTSTGQLLTTQDVTDIPQSSSDFGRLVSFSDTSVRFQKSDNPPGEPKKNLTERAISTIPPGNGSTLDIALDVVRQLVGDHFDTRMFLTGFGTEQLLQVELISHWLIQHLSGAELMQLLRDIKATETDRNGLLTLAPYSFVLRSAILLASEKMGTGMKSWLAYTRQIPGRRRLGGDELESWMQNHGNWIPEAQAVQQKHIETSFVKARRLAAHHSENSLTSEKSLIAYKGSSGAGKTFHGQEKFGLDDDQKPFFAGAVSSDRAKEAIRRAMPLSHNTVHMQSFIMGNNMVNGFIKQQSVDTVVYESSLYFAPKVSELVDKSEASQRSLIIIDVVRDDTARSLAVLSRTPEGADPVIPLQTFINGAESDRTHRAACMNVILGSTKKETTPAHSYELYSSNEQGGDRQKIVTLRPGEPPEWSMDINERTHRLHLLGLSFNAHTGYFEALNPCEPWSGHLWDALCHSVGDLVKGLSEQESLLREHQFALRTIRFERPADTPSVRSLYHAMPLELTQAFSLKDFEGSFSVLSGADKKTLLNTMSQASQEGGAVSYLELPATFALQLNSRLKQTPESWKERA